jgi:hypothetical protein
MKNKLWRSMTIGLCFGIFCASSLAQNETLAAAAGDRYVISAKAGGVNFVQGSVTVSRVDGTTGVLVKGDQLQINDKVSTGTDGKAEILLNPGSFVRLGGNTTFKFVTTSLEDLKLEISSGSAILEVFAAQEFQVAIATPKAKYTLIETGVYRIDVPNGDDARLRVWRGRALVNGSEDPIKGGRSATSGQTNGVAIAKFDRDEKDSLDEWSKTRGKDLAKVSNSFQRAPMRTALMRSFLGRRWNMYNSFGLWVFDPYFGSSCFLPFGYGWNSPYGFGYGSYLGWYGLPQVVYYPPPMSGGSSAPPVRGPVVSMDQTPPAAPFEKLQRTMGGGVRGASRDTTGPSYEPTRSSSPTYIPSTSAPAPTSSDSGQKSVSAPRGGIRRP